MLVIQCHCSEEPLLPILTKALKNKRQFVFTHCVFCGKNITWMNASEEKVREDKDVREISESEEELKEKLKPEELEWYQKKIKH